MNKTLLSILAGLGGMFGWGTSDFFANIASEKLGHAKTFFWSQMFALACIFIAVILAKPNFGLSPLFLGFTIFCGIAYASAYLLFYKGFEIGNVSVVSAVINLQAIFIILIAFIVRGQRLTTLQIPALILLLLGIFLVSVNFSDFKKGTITLFKGVKETFAAAVIFGVLYYPLNEYIVEQNDWLAVSFIVKLTAIIMVFLLYKFNKESLKIEKTSKKLLALIAAVGIPEAIAILSVTYGLSYGDSIIVAPIYSSLTIVTVSLAVIFLKEKVSRIQVIGIAMTIFGIILTAF